MLDGFMLDCNGYGPLLSMKKTETLVCSEEQKQEMMEYLDTTRAKDACVKALDLKLPMLLRSRLSTCLSSSCYKMRMIFPVLFKKPYFPGHVLRECAA